MTAPVQRSVAMGRRLTKRKLSSLLLYKFLHEYGYDKGEVVAGAIVVDICAVVRDYFAKPEELEPGQLIYWCPHASERAR